MNPRPKPPPRVILHVEDEDADAYILQFAFKKVGLRETVRATDGQMAIDYLSGAGPYADRLAYPLPELILLDLKLPKRSGLEVLEWIRSQPRLCYVVVIVCSSSAQPDDVARAYELGTNSFVQKPIGLENTLRLAQLLKDWWLGLNQFAHSRPQSSEHHLRLPPVNDQAA